MVAFVGIDVLVDMGIYVVLVGSTGINVVGVNWAGGLELMWVTVDMASLRSPAQLWSWLLTPPWLGLMWACTRA